MCNISSSVAANLVSTICDFRWLPSQVKYCTSADKHLTCNLTSNLSSADHFLAHLRSLDDVSFLVLIDSSDGLIVTEGKGRPRKEIQTPIVDGPIYER